MKVATRIIELFGGEAKVAEITGASISRVYRWTYDEARGGTGGRIPERHWPALFVAAKAQGIKLTPNDLYPEPHP